MNQMSIDFKALAKKAKEKEEKAMRKPKYRADSMKGIILEQWKQVKEYETIERDQFLEDCKRIKFGSIRTYNRRFNELKQDKDIAFVVPKDCFVTKVATDKEEEKRNEWSF